MSDISTPSERASEPNLLLNAFLHILKLNGVSSAKASFLNGIPPEDTFSTDGLIRATQAQGFSVNYLSKPIQFIDKSSYPLVLLPEQEGKTIRVLESYSETKQLYYLREFSQQNEKPQQIQLSLSSLLENHSGQIISFSRSVQNSSVKLKNNKPAATFSSWLIKELYRMRSIYRDVLLSAMFVNLFAIASPLFVMNVYDRVVPNQAIETLWVLASGVCLVFIFDLIIKLLRHYFIELTGKRIDLILSSRLFKQVMSLRAEAFPQSTGAFASQLRDFDSIKQFFTAATLTALVDLPFSVIFFLVIYYVGGDMVLAPLFAGACVVFYGVLVHFPLKRAIKKMQLAGAQKNSVVIESLSGIETLKAFNAEGRQQQLWEQSLNSFAFVSMTARRIADSISIVSGFIIQLAVVAVVIMGVYQIEAQLMSLGAMIACVLLSSRALAPMVQIANLLAQYYQAKTALSALDEICSRPIEHENNQQYLEMEACAGNIEIRDLTFAYSEKQPVLRALNIRLKPGERLAIIGKIGSGKSSLMRLLMGLGRPNEGQMVIDGIDIEHINPADLRDHVGYVPQEITLFKGTLRENILLKSPFAGQQELIQATKIAGLYDFVQKHSMGFDLPVGEQGKGLSGGQRQSVAIARAVIGNPRILLFDELTSAMDNQTEQAVIESIKAFSTDKTMIISTHRASLLALVDRIIVLDDGRVIADGPKVTVLDALKRGLIKTSAQVNENAK